MKTVAVLDYGMSNLGSVSKALNHVAGEAWQVLITNQAADVLKADKVVFPGQGAIGNCMELLRETGLDHAVEHALQHKPFLGICLGLQTLLTRSEENGGKEGFSFIAGTVRRFNDPLHDAITGERLKVPQMGWNQVYPTHDHALWAGIEAGSRFYFVHSYYVDPEDKSVIAATTPYGIDYPSVLAKDNVFAVQFHPEKSQNAGLTLLKNFLAW